MSSPVSVVIPTHDRAHLLGEAIESALAQTLPPHEILVVDDGSTDGTADLVRRWQHRHVRYIWQERRERSAARNAGIELARTPWIAFLDSDDFWDPNHLESLVRAVRPDVAAVYSGFRQSRGPGQPELRCTRDGRAIHARATTFSRALARKPRHRHAPADRPSTDDTAIPAWCTLTRLKTCSSVNPELRRH